VTSPDQPVPPSRSSASGPWRRAAALIGLTSPFVALSAALFGLLLWRSLYGEWVGDFWIYLPAVREVASSPLAPRNPLYAESYAFAFMTPYLWVLGLISRLSGVGAFETLVFQGLVNLVMLLGGLYAFVTTWTGRRQPAFFALLFVLFLWGPDPWSFSGFFHLRSLALVLPYPSTFASGVALLTLAGLPALAARRGGVVLLAFITALLLVVHPVTALFLWIGVASWSLGSSEPRRWRRWISLAGALLAGALLALGWPLTPMAELWFGQAALVHAGNLEMYEAPLGRIAPALLGLPVLLLRLGRRPRDPLALLFLALAACYLYGGLTAHWSFGRLLAHAVVALHVALADAVVDIELWVQRFKRGPVLRRAFATAIALALIAGAWNSSVRPILAEGRSRGLDGLAFLEKHVDRNAVVLADLDTSWFVPSLSSRVVAFPMPIPFVPDHAQRLEAVRRFYGSAGTQAERLALLQRYRVSHVLLWKPVLPDWRERLAELVPHGAVVYAGSDHVLLRVTPRPTAASEKHSVGDDPLG
jgi:alpha-1,6-mannosyltransferase